MIDTVSLFGSLGASDHNMLKWNVKLSPRTTTSKRSSFDYSKADFDAIRHALREIQWSDVLHGDANEQWITFSTSVVTVTEIGTETAIFLQNRTEP